MDFLKIKERRSKNGSLVIFPDFKVSKSKDLLTQGGEFFAIWDQSKGLWSRDLLRAQILIDRALSDHLERYKSENDGDVKALFISDFSNNLWSKFLSYVRTLPDNAVDLDAKVAFANTKVTRSDYISKKLDYTMEELPTPAFDELFETLYDKQNLDKILWAIGSVISGDSKRIHKFFVFFGPPGTGKSTVLNLVQSMFPHYYKVFDAKALASGGQFAMEALRSNPLIGINHEGDFSYIKDNSVLNSIASHDEMLMNIKHARAFSIKLHTMLFAATNKPVKITDAGSGILRRLIDVRPTGRLVPESRYNSLVAQIAFELPGIAHKALHRYNSLGLTYYGNYKSMDMFGRTNVVYNFVDENYLDFVREGHLTLSRAWTLYQEYCEASDIKYRLPKHQLRDELKSYFDSFEDRLLIDGRRVRSVFVKLRTELFEDIAESAEEEPIPDWLTFEEQHSVLDDVYLDQKAQYERKRKKWENVKTRLKDIQTKRLHYVLPMPKHVVIDFDIKDGEGNKSLALNIKAAADFPPTYAELSKSGEGIHLHYIYDGVDVSKLSRIYDEGIEVLPAVGLFSVRRKLTKCNSYAIAHISSGLPLKGDRAMVSSKTVRTERSIRLLILRNINKDIHPNTKPSMDFIATILKEAYASGVVYDVENLKKDVVQFANNSTNHSRELTSLALSLPYISKAENPIQHKEEGEPIVFFDLEVFPNLLLVGWKFAGPDASVNFLFNPTPSDIEGLLKTKLIGYNNRRYDNHILYARYLGFTINQIYQLSYDIVHKRGRPYFREAYGLSYTDVFDYSSSKKTLKQWEVDLGLKHNEFDHPWDEPLPEEEWERAAEYCGDDVVATEQVHNHLLLSDFRAREIIAALSGLTINDTTSRHTARIIFGEERNPQSEFVYTDLSEQFPGYKFEHGKSTYRDDSPSEGGYVNFRPGMYLNPTIYMDVVSMHPASIEMLNFFGKFTRRYLDLRDARVYIREGDYESARKMFDGILTPFLEDESAREGLAYALKIVINIVYGLTCTKYPNIFKDPRNVDNIVAKRGALFMIDLRLALEDRGVEWVHFKTDSVKVTNYTEEDVSFIVEFAKRYGYVFKVEGIYEKMTLINKSVLIGKMNGKWSPVGAQFAEPYVYKTLFSKEPIEFNDMTVVKSVKDATIYLEMPDGKSIFIGKTGRFSPVLKGGGDLVRVAGEKKGMIQKTTGYKWLPSEMLAGNKGLIDRKYFINEVDNAVAALAKFGDVTAFLD